jgi:hypothetical protein
MDQEGEAPRVSTDMLPMVASPTKDEAWKDVRGEWTSPAPNA